MAERFLYRRLDGYSYQHFARDDVTVSIPVRPKARMLLKVDPEEASSLDERTLKARGWKAAADGSVWRPSDLPMAIDWHRAREYLLVGVDPETPEGRWIVCRSPTYPGDRFIEVDPAEVIRDLEENGIQLPPELKHKRDLDNGPEILPHWDRETRKLWYGETLCRGQGREAHAQFQIFAAFQAADWKTPIRAPFTEKQLRDTIRNLNKRLTKESPIKFAPSGPAEMSWKLR